MPQDISTFLISDADAKKINAWKKQQEKKTKGEYGAIGGGYTYEFTPTGLGIIFKVTNAVTKQTLDLTEYDKW